MRNSVKLSLFALGSMLMWGCHKDDNNNQVNCDTEISYASDIQPLLNTNCSTSGCHDAQSNSAGYVFENYSQANDNASIILSVIKHENGFQAMPQNAAKLSDEQIKLVECWIQQGKLNN